MVDVIPEPTHETLPAPAGAVDGAGLYKEFNQMRLVRSCWKYMVVGKLLYGACPAAIAANCVFVCVNR